jgi:hypothetical protein
MNIFQIEYETRLQSWHDLKEDIKISDLKTKVIKIDNWWQNAPTVNHYLHLKDTTNWPDPWELLVENLYCNVAKALGMCYTLYMTGEQNFQMVTASDEVGNDVVLVIVDDKYILNYWPNTVEMNVLSNFTIKDKICLRKQLERLG